MTVPLLIETPEQMAGAIEDVLSGEYECGLFGEGLTIADIGANVGSFAIWATARWPGSKVTAFEPNPGTFAMLERNVRAYEGISAVNVAVYPTSESRIAFSARYPGDGEAGVAQSVEATFGRVPRKRQFEVPALHPREVPPSDIVKIDAEGSEAEIVRHLDLSSTSLILLEFQTDENRGSIKSLLSEDFDLILEEAFPWSPLLEGEYNPSLAGNHYGHLFFKAKSGCKLQGPPTPTRSQPSWRSIASAAYRKLARRQA
jgi:FkbM family methyltransferase